MSGHISGKAVHSVNCMFLCTCVMSICNLVISHFGFEDMNLVLIVQVPSHCLRFTLFNISYYVLLESNEL